MLENAPLPWQSVAQFWKELWVLDAPWWQDGGRRESGRPVLPTAPKGPVLRPSKTHAFPTQACPRERILTPAPTHSSKPLATHLCLSMSGSGVQGPAT